MEIRKILAKFVIIGIIKILRQKSQKFVIVFDIFINNFAIVLETIFLKIYTLLKIAKIAFLHAEKYRG